MRRAGNPLSGVQHGRTAPNAAHVGVGHQPAGKAVMSDEHWTPHVPAPVRKPTPGIVVWTLEKNRRRRSCELRMHGPNGEWGVETQILNDGELLIGRRFDTDDLALQWAKVEREAHERRGWTQSG